ncbi:DNA polymerase epsilon subunit B, putative [Talaromyces stipitatus ATCC 10500]|uniref:DNA polymerase epsilon subunit B n=1 Tax=Talaromyces stipitatus (strain ATCC 10500 / CBS 375.48 / QM 6759 / NRRL 1006) TaxID=441959 RepID=B8LT90_TALSN|nr:DNA polymerase epsilon subunit B, putative [Talaromyces stipitatus ATCC 10500]EED23598.1 DNA polymerase epsilon subunit B, putative [Talaromyces stipitatus ATCC 10500]
MDKAQTPKMPLPIRGADIIPSSSPAFGTPARPVRTGNRPNTVQAKSSVLPVLLPPALLRPLAFRTFTRKHDLTISSNTLQTLAIFIGKNCGSRWREDGLAERLLDEVAKLWRKNGGGVIVEEGNGASIKAILQMVEGNMTNGKVVPGKSADQEDRRGSLTGPASTDERVNSNAEEEDESLSTDPRRWMKVIDAYDQPRLTYNPNKKHFETSINKPSFFPDPSHQITFYRDRLLRNESFQASSLLNNNKQTYKITPIANLIGRGGSRHMCLGLLSVSPAGELSLTDLTGSIMLDLSETVPIPRGNGAWFCPGMMVLVEGIYEEEEIVKGSVLGGNSGIGGAIGGKLMGITIAGPPCEKREVTLGMNSIDSKGDIGTSGGFGWVDFLGVGSERAQGARMRKMEHKSLRQVAGTEGQRNGRCNIVILGEIHLDNTRTLDALKSVFGIYNALPFEELPLAFVMIGNFIGKVGFGQSNGGNSIEYKECFDSLASVLSDFSALLSHTTFIFVPGDNDPWASTFTVGASSAIPRKGVPELFTSRVKRAFTAANNDAGNSASKSTPGEAIWTSNPSRISLFGPVHEIVVYRDDISGRLRRNSIRFCNTGDNDLQEPQISDGATQENDENMIIDNDDNDNNKAQKNSPIPTKQPPPSYLAAQKLSKTILDQGTLSPFPITSKPVLWDYASSIQLYPLPTALILADSEVAAFSVSYEGCNVLNPGRFVPEDYKREPVTWVEYDVLRKRGKVRQQRI